MAEEMNTQSSGLQPNVAAALSYVLGFLTGILFLLISKDKFVRFHAMQSILTFGALFVVSVVVGVIPGIGSMLSPLISVLSLVLWVVLLVKAYQGQKFKLPVVGDLAEKNS